MNPTKFVTLRVPDRAGSETLAHVKSILLAHPGDHEFTLVVGRHNRERRITFGSDFYCDGSKELCARLSEHGSITVTE
jgi:hypothetical protein